MSRVPRWSVRNARWLEALYRGLERPLLALHPLLARIGYRRLEPAFVNLEDLVKGFFFDSQSCGQCTLAATGMVCPMNCPKSLRNGPCGGVRADGSCEIRREMTCVWVGAWEGSQRIRDGVQAIQVLQPPLDVRLRGSSSWLNVVREKVRSRAVAPDAL